jgi:hypothetical protein
MIAGQVVRLWVRIARSLALLAMSSAMACGGAQPSSPAAGALHRDLERLVELSDTEGWSIDRVELDEALPSALMSVCRTTEPTRTALLAWLDTRIAKLGGPVREAYEARGRKLDAVEDLLSITRIRMLLAMSIERSAADCPFWIHARPNFNGRQILDDRFLLSAGGGGKGIMIRQLGDTDLNFGGAGRVLVGRGIGQHATLLAGVEIGGSAAFPQDEEGERGPLAIAVDVVTPLVYRHRLVNSYWEVEAGYVAHLTEGEDDPAHGLHLGMAFGGTAARRRWVFPGVAFGVGYERINEDKILHVVKIGFRVALDFVK